METKEYNEQEAKAYILDCFREQGDFSEIVDEKTLGESALKGLIQYMQSGPVVAMVVEGIQAIDMVRKLAGPTLPFKAEMGTIRGDFSVDNPIVANVEGRSIHNLFHASENPEEAENEIKLWFGGETICDYSLGDEDIMYCKHY